MLEMLFAFTLGFGGMAMGCFSIVGQDDGIQSAGITALAAIVLLAVVIAFQNGGLTNPRDMLMYLIGEAGTTHVTITVIGAALGMAFVMYVEGTFYSVWRRIHPSSAPTDFIGAGARGSLPNPPPKISAALMGTSTSAFAVQGLDVKTTALIRLAMFAFKRDRFTIATLESALKLGDSRRHYAFQKLVADSANDKALKDIIHPYWRAINGNHSSARLMFTNLCQLARDTRNTNKRAVNTLVSIGQSLGLSPKDMAIAIGNLRK